MRRLAELLSDLAAAPHAAARMRRLEAYFEAGRHELDCDFGYALGWLCGALKPKRLRPAQLQSLAENKVDPTLFRLSAAAIGDVSEAVALIWPGTGDTQVSVAADGKAPPDLILDRLDADARLAFVRLVTGRKVKGVKPREVRQALATVFAVDADLIAGALIQETPPYPRLCAWLAGAGPAPNWAPPKPPPLPRLTAPPEDAFDAWPMPDGAPVGLTDGRAFDAEGAEVKLTSSARDGWGFADKGRVSSVEEHAALSDPKSALAAGRTLLIRIRKTGEWAILPPAARRIICPVTFIESGRAVNVTLAVLFDGSIAPLIKLAAPEAAKVSAFARKAMIDKFGPVRQVGPGLWAELRYDAVRPAPRRKIGMVLEGASIERLIWGDGPAAPDLTDIA